MMDSTRERDRRALHDLAKLASAPSSQPAPRSSQTSLPASADHSGVVDLQALMASDPNWVDAAVARAKTAANAARTSALPSTPTSIAPLVLESPVSHARDLVDDAPVAKKRGGIVIASIVALAMVGAAGLVAFKLQAHSTKSAATAGTEQPLAAAAVAPATQAPSAVTASAVTATPAPIPPPPPVAAAPVNPGAAAVAAADTEEATPKGKHHHHAARGGKHGGSSSLEEAMAASSTPAAPAAEPAAAAPAEPTPAPVAPAKHEAAPKDDSPLSAAIRASAGGGGPGIPTPPSSPASAPASDPAPAARRAPAGDRPDRPSPSNVMSALQERLPAARACVASASGPSRVKVTFGSEGNVTGVDVSGAAQGDAGMTKCLKGALGKAKVSPFGDPSYSAAVNVRPE